MSKLTIFEIECNYHAAMTKAQEIENIARSIRNTTKNEIEFPMNTLPHSWQGEGSNAYISRSSRVIGDLMSLASDLDKIASTIRSIAKRDYNAEMRALEISNRRSY